MTRLLTLGRLSSGRPNVVCASSTHPVAASTEKREYFGHGSVNSIKVVDSTSYQTEI